MSSDVKNVTLRPLEPEDVDLLYTVENDREQWRFSSSNVPYSRFFLTNYILTSTADIYTDKQLRMVVEGDGKPVGLVDLVNFDPDNNRAEVGIIVFDDYRGCGIGSRALSLLIDYAHERLHLCQLYAYIAADNEMSLRTFGKCGFQHTATLQRWFRRGENYLNSYFLQLFLKKNQ